MWYLADGLAGGGNLESGTTITWSHLGKAAAGHLAAPSTKAPIDRVSAKKKVATEEAAPAGPYVAVSAVVRDLRPRGVVR